MKNEYDRIAFILQCKEWNDRDIVKEFCTPDFLRMTEVLFSGSISCDS